jgi:cytochrome c oxidase assembly protein subunit 11
MSERNRRRTVILSLLAAAAMVGIAYASVPLYRMFCSATGYGGTVQRAAAAPVQTRNRTVTVSFDTNVDPNLPWDFKPEKRNIEAKLGETRTVNFIVHNRSDKSVVGEATYNVQPDKAGPYFDKLQCFCFDKQALAPKQTVKMAVQFYVDPAIADDKDTNDVQNITLSYTFFRAKEQGHGADVHSSLPSTPQPKPGKSS